jgi:putative endopeptidase
MKLVRRSPFAALLLAAIVLAPTPSVAKGDQAKPIDPANLDLSVRPADDFFLYANGSWLKANPIPGDQTEWGGFIQLYEHNNEVLHGILEDAAKQKGAPKGTPLQLVGDFYASAMDSARADAEGTKPIADELARIAAIGTTDANSRTCRRWASGYRSVWA